MLQDGKEFTVNGKLITGEGVVSDTPPEVTFVAFNTAVPPYDDVEFRRALSAAADVGDLDVRYLVGFPDEPAAGILPPMFPGHDASIVASVPDRSRAEDALAESQYDDSPESLSITFLTERIEIAEHDFASMTANWDEWLGLVPRYGTDNIHGNGQEMREAFNSALEEGTLQMRFVRITPRYPDPHAILGVIPDLFGENAESQETRQLKALLQAAATEPDAAARLERYQDIERHIIDRALVFPLFWDDGGSYHIVRDWLHGFQIPKYGGSVFKNVWIDVSHPSYPSDRSTD